MLYLSPVWHTLQAQNRERFGYIVSLHAGAGVGSAVLAGHRWMLDNGAFSDKWNEATWLAALERWQPYAGTCIAAVCPDVVGDAGATLARFAQYAPTIRNCGYPVAFVTQDGLAMDAVPWGQFDVLFVGGTDQHKLHDSYPFILEAQRRGLWVHVGRVNSAERITGKFWMADSCDGTMLAIEPSPRRQSLLLNAATVASAKKEMPTLL
jgi:hypothetical protein